MKQPLDFLRRTIIKMNNEPNLSYERIGKTRMQRLHEWRAGNAHTFRAWRRDVVGRFTQRGWLEVEATVTSCEPIRTRYPGGYSKYAQGPMLGGWDVGFSYDVGGKTFDGFQISKDKLEKGETFSIRCNPDRPEENNSLSTKLDWIDGPIMDAYYVLVAVLIGGLIIAGISLNR